MHALTYLTYGSNRGEKIQKLKEIITSFFSPQSCVSKEEIS